MVRSDSMEYSKEKAKVRKGLKSQILKDLQALEESTQCDETQHAFFNTEIKRP